MYQLNEVLNNILEEHEKDMIKALYKYDWYTHILMVKIPKTRTKAYRDNEIDRKFMNIFYHYFGI